MSQTVAFTNKLISVYLSKWRSDKWILGYISDKTFDRKDFNQGYKMRQCIKRILQQRFISNFIIIVINNSVAFESLSQYTLSDVATKTLCWIERLIIGVADDDPFCNVHTTAVSQLNPLKILGLSFYLLKMNHIGFYKSWSPNKEHEWWHVNNHFISPNMTHLVSCKKQALLFHFAMNLKPVENNV